MQRGSGEPGTASSDAAAARRWADRLERRPWRWLFTRWVVVGVLLGFVAMLGAYEWWRYVQVAHGAEPLLECHSTEPPERAYDVGWQWMPPGPVCDYSDGDSQYLGL